MSSTSGSPVEMTAGSETSIAGCSVGDLVSVEFLDHCQNGDGLLHCTVFGRLSAIAEDHISVQCWITTDHKDEENTTTFHIIRKTIERMTAFVHLGK